jgi:PAS domain S-box-containing protein
MEARLIRIERLIGACATLMALFGLAIHRGNALSPWAVGALTALGVHGLLTMLLVTHPGLRSLWTGRARVIQHGLDLVLVLLVLVSTGGAASYFFTYLLYPVLAGALVWGVGGAFWTAVASLGAYALLVGVTVALPGSPLVPRYGIRLMSMAVMAGLLGYVALPLGALRGGVGEEEAALAMVLDGLGDGAVISDEHGVVRSVNLAAAGMFGVGRDDALGRRVLDFIPEVDVGAVMDALRRANELGGVPHPTWSVEGFRVDGTRFPIELTVGLVRVGDRHMFLSVLRDVSRRKLVEAEERKVLETRAAEEERTRLVQDLHDGLLQTLTGAALQLRSIQTLLNDDGAVPEARVRLVEVREALAAEQRELRYWASEIKPTLLGIQKDRLEDRLLVTLERVRATWRIETDLRYALDETLPPGPRQQVYRIVQEAVVNAAQHSRASRVEVHLTQRDGALRIVVSDDGTGFPFEGRYEQEQLEAERLGPLLLRHRVMAADGRLAIDSSPEGARLEILLPLGGAA